MTDGEPNLIISGMSQRIIKEGVQFRVEIRRLEDDGQWSLGVVTEDGTTIVWNDLFDDGAAEFDEAVNTIRQEGPCAFAAGGSNVIPLRP